MLLKLLKNYNCENLIGQQITAVVNFPNKQIANIQSEFLTLGAINKNLDDVILIQPLPKQRMGLKFVNIFEINKQIIPHK